MDTKSVENYFKEKISELLHRIKTFEDSIIGDREAIEGHRKAVLAYKQANKENGKFSDVKPELVGMIKKHYYSFLLSDNLKSELERTCELATAADVLGIELDFPEEDAQALANIKSNHMRIFGVTKDDEGNEVVGLLDSPMKHQIEHGVNTRVNDTATLKDAYENMSPAQTQ